MRRSSGAGLAASGLESDRSNAHGCSGLVVWPFGRIHSELLGGVYRPVRYTPVFTYTSIQSDQSGQKDQRVRTQGVSKGRFPTSKQDEPPGAASMPRLGVPHRAIAALSAREGPRARRHGEIHVSNKRGLLTVTAGAATTGDEQGVPRTV